MTNTKLRSKSNEYDSGLPRFARDDRGISVALIAILYKKFITKRLLQRLSLLCFFVIAVSCGVKGGVAQTGAYVGTAKGLYATVHYKVEDNRLLIAFENTTTAAMSNLIINVSQKTPVGSSDMQGSARLLKVRNVYRTQLSLASNTTGDITLSYFFIPKAEGGMGLSPYQSEDFASNMPGSEYGSFMDDVVEFKISLP